MNDLITIVVPIYNLEKYIEKCIESIRNQTYQNLEIILVDDGSTDRSSEICDRYQKKDSRITVIHKTNGGLSDARNKGIEIASGKYIGFVDGDDYIHPQMYEILYTSLVKVSASIAIGGRKIVYDYNDEEVQPDLIVGTDKVLNTVEALIELNSFSTFDMSACDKLYDIHLFKQIQFPFGKKCEDYYTMYKLFDASDKVVYNKVPLYYYYQRENSISRNAIIDFSYMDASLEQLSFFKNKYPLYIYIAETAVAFSTIAIYNKYIIYNIKCSKKQKKIFKKQVCKMLSSVFKNRYISLFKKGQAFIFSISVNGYKIFYKIFKNRK